MCGIAGYVGDGSRELLATMLGDLRHRGPDGEGVYVAPGIGLGMTRLAIIDLVTGDQPISNEDRSLSIVFNGEIYNYRELRSWLEARGHRFRTHSDTETIVHLFEEEGERCVERLRGMFAFAIWDARRRALFLARDRLGKKPLYFWRGDGLLLFASEIKALLHHPAVSRALNWSAFHHYLGFGYAPGDASVFAEIGKLAPAHTATWRDGLLTTRRYWALPEGPDDGSPAPSLPETAERIRQALGEAVHLRLESDVPVGVFLSGGIDSSAIVASMREATSGRIETFSIGFGTAAPSYDELRYARLIAQRFDTDHHEEILEPKLSDLLPTIVRHFDEPFADSSAIPTFVVAGATAGSVKVALSGIGGDETFAGYPRYLGVRLSQAYRRLPRAIRALAKSATNRLSRDAGVSRSWRDWAWRFAAGGDVPMPDGYLEWTRLFSEAALGGLATAELRSTWDTAIDRRQRAAFATRGHDDPLDGAFRIDLDTYLPDDLLVMADRMGMAHSLEVRAPFCDHRLIEESLRIAPRMKISGLRLKTLLKLAFEDRLPAEILAHRKQGFMVPLGRWLRSDLRSLMDDLLSAERVRARGLFVPTAVERLKREHLDGRRNHGDRLWTLMMAELWMQEYLDTARPWTASARPAVRRGRGPALRILEVSDVSPMFIQGGGERVLWEHASGLARRGHDVRVLSRSPAAGVPGEDERAGVRIRHFAVERRSLVPFVRSSIAAAGRAFADEVGRAGADVLHLHQPLSGFGVYRSPAGRRLPSLYTFLSPAVQEYLSRRGSTVYHRRGTAGWLGGRFLWAIERSCLHRAGLIHVLSDFSAQQLGKLYRVPQERIVKIPGGADTQMFRPGEDRAGIRDALGLPARRPVLLTVRNLENRMGLDVLLEGMARLRAHYPEALLVVGGAGFLRQELESLSDRLGLGGQVRFVGYIPEARLVQYYQAADAFVLPTRALEGFGLVTVEALACGTPVLGTRIGATPEILSPISPSLLFRAVSPEAIADGVRRFLDAMTRDPDDYRRLRERCRQHVQRRYSWDQVVKDLEAVLRDLAERRT